MATIGMGLDISPLVDAIAMKDANQIIAVARKMLRQGAPAAELIGRVGMVTAHGDPEGHAILTLSAAAHLSRMVAFLPPRTGEDPASHLQELPLLIQAVVATESQTQAGQKANDTYPAPLFPSGLSEGKTVNDFMHDAVYNNDPQMVEQLLFGLYGTGADYRTMEVRAYDGISTTFQNAGHPLMFAVRGFQLLDTVEWGDRAPNILYWLSPHLPLHTAEPDWIHAVRTFNDDPAHSMAGIRTRLAAPKNENALPLRTLILNNADTTQVCQGVYDAIMKGGASPTGVGSVIALAATDLMQLVGDTDRDAFVQAAHGLLFAAATRLVFARLQDVEALPLLFTSASYIHALKQAFVQQSNVPQMPAIPTTPLGAGLIAAGMLGTLREQLHAQDLRGAFSTARRYLRLEEDARLLFGTVGLIAAQADAAVDQGHTLQIVQAAAEEFMAWPAALDMSNRDGFLEVALRAAAFAPRNALVANI